MSDFWQAPGNGLILNLEHVVAVDRMSDGDLRIVTVLASATLTLKGAVLP